MAVKNHNLILWTVEWLLRIEHELRWASHVEIIPNSENRDNHVGAMVEATQKQTEEEWTDCLKEYCSRMGRPQDWRSE